MFEKIVLIDSDSLIWAASYSSQTEEDVYVYIRDKITSILSATQCQKYCCFVGGHNNFRKIIDKSYKANRAGKEVPQLFNFAKNVFLNDYKTFVVNGVETDDCVVATYRKCIDAYGIIPVIASIDKDYKIKNVEIYNYNSGEHSIVTDDEAFDNFATMMITGDAGDNIKTCHGLGKSHAKKLFAGKTRFGKILALGRTYRKFYGYRWRLEMSRVYMLLNLVDDYNIINIPSEEFLTN